MEPKEFFKDSRREVEIMDYHILKSAGNERRVKSNLRLPLAGGRSVVGMPEWILDGREAVVKDRGLHRKVVCDVEIEGVSTEFFNTPEVKRRTQMLNGATLKQFTIERVGKDEKAEVYLNFVLYAPCSKEIADWWYDHLHGSCYIQFDATQAAFSYDGEEHTGAEDSDQLPLLGDGDESESDEEEAPSRGKKGGKKK